MLINVYFLLEALDFWARWVFLHISKLICASWAGLSLRHQLNFGRIFEYFIRSVVDLILFTFVYIFFILPLKELKNTDRRQKERQYHKLFTGQKHSHEPKPLSKLSTIACLRSNSISSINTSSPIRVTDRYVVDSSFQYS